MKVLYFIFNLWMLYVLIKWLRFLFSFRPRNRNFNNVYSRNKKYKQTTHQKPKQPFSTDQAKDAVFEEIKG